MELVEGCRAQITSALLLGQDMFYAGINKEVAIRWQRPEMIEWITTFQIADECECVSVCVFR